MHSGMSMDLVLLGIEQSSLALATLDHSDSVLLLPPSTELSHAQFHYPIYLAKPSLVSGRRLDQRQLDWGEFALCGG
jgi:hypothetical protein